MSRKVLYVAHPVRPTDEEIDAISSFQVERSRGEYEPDMKVFVAREARVHPALRANIDRAMAWLRWLRRSFPETTFIAPWIAAILSGEDDADPAQREAALRDDCAVIERCDGIVLCGARISEGMSRELQHGRSNSIGTFEIYSLTSLTEFPDRSAASGLPFSEAMGVFRVHR